MADMAETQGAQETHVTQEMQGESTIKLPKNCKETRYYYRNREQILEKRRQKKLEDPDYQAKLQAKEEAKKAREEERVAKKKEIAREKAKKKAELLGILPTIPSGVNESAS